MPLRITILLYIFLFGKANAQLPALIPYTDGKLWGYADTNGKVVIQPQWHNARFFSNGKAIVAFPANGWYGNRFCLIDQDGNYIIDSSKHWTGEWNNWGHTYANIRQGSKVGLIDTLGNVLIPCEYDDIGMSYSELPLVGSFKVVTKDGYVGLINRNNEIVVPIKYGGITIGDHLQNFGGVKVEDPDNIHGANKFGIADLNGNLILPMKYEHIEYYPPPAGPAFRLVKNLYNQSAPNTAAAKIEKWIAYPSFKEIPPIVIKEQQYQEPGGLISFGNGHLRGLKNNAGKVTIPCCSVRKVTADTIYTQAEDWRNDSLFLVYSYLSPKTMKKMAPDSIYILYEHREIRRDLCGNIVGSYDPIYQRSMYSRENARPSLRIGDRDVQNFYKDSFLFSIQERIASSAKQMLIVRGDVIPKKHNRNYYAIIDSNFNYVVPPLEGQYILDYNPIDSIVTVSAYKGNKTLRALLSQSGTVLMDYRDHELKHGLLYKGKVYATVTTKKEYFDNDGRDYARREYVTESRLMDASGFIETFKKNINLPFLLRYEGAMPRHAVEIKDSFGKVAYFYPEGEAVYPALNYKYRSLTSLHQGIILAVDSSNVGRIVNTENKELFPGLKANNFERAGTSSRIFARSNQNDKHLPGLFAVTIRDEKKNLSFRCYMDHKGRLYYSGAYEK